MAGIAGLYEIGASSKEEARGRIADMTKPGALAGVLSEYVENAELRRVHGSVALHRARATFSHDAVVPQIIEMYGDVLVS